MKKLAMMVGLVVVGSVAASMAGDILYSEDFESYADGTPVTNALPGGPGWVNYYMDNGVGTPRVEENESPYNSSPPFDTRALYTHTTAGNEQNQPGKPFANPGYGILRLTYKAYARSAISSCHQTISPKSRLTSSWFRLLS